MTTTFKNINRTELKKLIDGKQDLTLIETLPEDKFKEFHLPDAINIPMDENFDSRIQKTVPNKNERIVVYCWDKDCDASEKAASRLTELGYTNVLDYAEGKKAWKEAGEPIREPATTP